jgi:DNA-binding NarL/FixJ family response regulator
LIRLAVVDDEALDRDYAVDGLHARFGADATVEGFTSVEQMLASGQEFDLVVLDLGLRDAEAEHADAVRLAARRATVVVFSGQKSGEAVRAAEAAGALGYVSKDSSDRITTLVTAIRQASRGEPFMDPELQDRIGASARRVLTPRQQEVLRLEALGRTTRQIARALDLSEAGVRRHIEHIVEIHPDCGKQADRVRLAVELGLVSPWEDYHAPPAAEN